MDQPFFVLAVPFTLCRADPFSFLWLFPRKLSCPLQRGVDWKRKSSLLRQGPPEKEEQVQLGRGLDLPTVALIQEALWEVWAERELAAQEGD